ncbi:MAG: FAD binding domain-containing protein [Geminicoccaceae bacterium]
MRPFAYHRAADVADAVASLGGQATVLAGGTNLVDLMKLEVMTPAALVDITGIAELAGFDTAGDPLRFGALARMADLARDPVLEADYPALSESLWQAASPQLRNSATLAGNLLQRTRCYYFRDTSYACNRRARGSGCAAQDGINRMHAVLGGSEHCVATHPSDWAVALVAFDAVLHLCSPRGERTMPLSELHRLPGDTPHLETTLEGDELITAITVPATPAGRRSCYLKVRDRESYAFATASAAIGLEMDGDTVRAARIALGGVATVPWRARAAEAELVGQRLSEESARRAAKAAFEGARPLTHNRFKVELGKQTVVEALMTAARKG